MPDIIINADDFALDGEVDKAILQLAAKGAVTAASAMVLSPRWPAASDALRDAPLSRGLHLDLTSPFAARVFPGQPLPALIARSHAGLLDRSSLRRAVGLQFSLFEDRLGGAPDFVDGHQHVHHLPSVRDVLFDEMEDRYGSDAQNIGLRVCLPRHWRGVKAFIVGATGASVLARCAAERGHRANTDFAGVYNFSPEADLAMHWQSWMTGLEGARPLIMCHVATRSNESLGNDPIRQARYREYDWLSSEEFRALAKRLSANPKLWPRA